MFSCSLSVVVCELFFLCLFAVVLLSLWLCILVHGHWRSSVSASNSSSSWSVMSSVSLCVFVLVHSSFFVLLLVRFCVCLYVSAFVFVFVGVYFRVRTFDQLCLGKQQQLFLVCDVALCVWFACRWLCGQAFIFLRLFVSVRLYLCLSVVVFVGMHFFSMGNGQAETDEIFADQWDPQQH